MKKRFLYILLAATMFFSSCSHFLVISGERVRPLGVKKLYSGVVNGYQPYSSLSVKFDASLETGDINQSVSGILRIRKDSVIWISIVPALGIEAARIQFRPDSIMFINRIKNEYFTSGYDYLENKFQTEINYSNLQAILTNEIFLYSDNDDELNEKMNSDSMEVSALRKTFIASIDSDRYVLKTHRKHRLKKQLRRNKTAALIVETIRIAPQIFKVTRVDIDDYSEKRHLAVDYSDYKKITDKVFPTSLGVEIKTPDKLVKCSLTYNKISVDGEMTFPFKITDKYKRIY